MDEGSKKRKKSSVGNIEAELPKEKSWSSKKLKRLKRQEKLLRKVDENKKSKAEATSNSDDDGQAVDIGNETLVPTTDDESVNGSNPETNATGNPGRPFTVSLAVAGSIIDNAQTPPLKAYLAGQVARAAAIFRVDEVVVYDDTGGHSEAGCQLMARILQFMECPQYLRKELFPLHPDLQYAGLIAPLDIPHHLRKHEALPFREGVVSKKPVKDGKEYALVNVGLDRDCRINKKLPPGIRVTVKFDNPTPEYILKPKGKLKGTVVSPHAPRRESGLYWGYTVRLAPSLQKIFSECPFKEGYDVKIGTSEKGTDSTQLQPKSFNHLLIVFGGVEGLEFALENDETLHVDDVSCLFDHYVNTCPSQGSRTIRTEEAILISMNALSKFINGKE